MTAVFALATSLLLGLADFGGGLLSKRLRELTVVVASQGIATVVLAVVVVAAGAWSGADARLLWCATAAGAIGPLAMLCFYRALAAGPMGVVSPLATLGAAVVLVGVGVVVHGEHLGGMQAVGTLVAVVGVVLAGGVGRGGAPVRQSTVLLTLMAALGFGATMSLVAEASTTLTGLFLTLFVQRLVNVLVGGGALWASVRRGTPALPAGPGGGMKAIRSALPALAFVGLADVAANGTYAVAAQNGPVTVAAVLASLYPVITALAARGILHERLRALQTAGAGLALAGSLLLASG